mgnify:CR=1
MKENELVCFEQNDLEKVRAVMKRLYTENRLNGDEMRNLAHTLNAFLNCAMPLSYDQIK